jgi:hypothetical protein
VISHAFYLINFLVDFERRRRSVATSNPQPTTSAENKTITEEKREVKYRSDI